jgi:hypothetical protein
MLQGGCRPPPAAPRAHPSKTPRKSSSSRAYLAALSAPGCNITATRVRFRRGGLRGRRRESQRANELGGAGDGVRTRDIQLGNRAKGLRSAPCKAMWPTTVYVRLSRPRAVQAALELGRRRRARTGHERSAAAKGGARGRNQGATRSNVHGRAPAVVNEAHRCQARAR